MLSQTRLSTFLLIKVYESASRRTAEVEHAALQDARLLKLLRQRLQGSGAALAEAGAPSSVPAASSSAAPGSTGDAAGAASLQASQRSRTGAPLKRNTVRHHPHCSEWLAASLIICQSLEAEKDGKHHCTGLPLLLDWDMGLQKALHSDYFSLWGGTCGVIRPLPFHQWPPPESPNVTVLALQPKQAAHASPPIPANRRPSGLHPHPPSPAPSRASWRRLGASASRVGPP